MQIVEFAQIAFLVVAILVVSYYLGIYMGRIYLGKRSSLDRYLGPLENGLYRLMGINPRQEMNWKEYLGAFLLTNLAVGIIGFLVLFFQQSLPLNPNHVGSLSPLLDVATSVSFLTNTNLQHYAGQLQLSYFSQMGAITFLMFTSAASGIVVAVALIRGMVNQSGTIGNFYRDFTITITRVLLPISVIEAIVFVALGVPQTFQGAVIAHTINMGNQTIFRGPVASLEAIKFLGTNGGGFFGAGASYPFENPNAIAAYIQMITEASIPFGLIFAYGNMVRNPRQGRMLVAVTMALFLLGLTIALAVESSPNNLLNGLLLNQSAGNWAGKDSRFSIAESTFSLILNTYTQTGAPMVSLNQMNPLSIAAALFGMEVQGSPGGAGTGLMNLMVYVILAVFISGLMVGRTPEFLGKRVSTGIMKYAVVFVLIHPFIILTPIAVSVMSGYANFISLPPNEAFTSLLYEFTSAASNNGSSFGYVLTSQNSTFFLAVETVVMLIGRFAPIAVAIAIAGVLSSTKPLTLTKSVGVADDPIFAIFLFAFIIVLSALLFLPVLALGPLAGFLGG